MGFHVSLGGVYLILRCEGGELGLPVALLSSLVCHSESGMTWFLQFRVIGSVGFVGV